MLTLHRKKRLINFGMVTLGCVLFALSFDLFLDPSRIAPGGVSGLAMVVKYLTGLPIGVGILLMNIPLQITAFLKLGKRFILYTAYATALSSILIDLWAFLPAFTNDLLLASIYGGLLMGAGMGMVFAGGATTGGSDVISRLVRLRYPHVRLGKIILLVDCGIVAVSATVFQDINRALYAAISLYVSSLVIDMIMNGFDYATMIYIISDFSSEIAAKIQDKLERGVTYLNGQGAYEGAPKKVILCTVKRNESAALYDIVHEIDPNAFLIASEAHQVFGYGFSPYQKSG
ncbi:MAG: YitT family protein [Ruminococcaceae bacterium]|nr:YitT family protein [Oscillospiraceae bacterium]